MLSSERVYVCVFVSLGSRIGALFYIVCKTNSCLTVELSTRGVRGALRVFFSLDLLSPHPLHTDTLHTERGAISTSARLAHAVDAFTENDVDGLCDQEYVDLWDSGAPARN